MRTIVVNDTITTLGASAAARQIVVTGSHAGRLAASYAVLGRADGLIAHDASIGLDDAGIASLVLLEREGVPAAAVAAGSARIGEGRDVLAHGTLGTVNASARALGIAVGWPAREAAEAMAAAADDVPHPLRDIPLIPPRELPGTGSQRPLWLLDTASDVGPEHAGAVVVTGSHANLIGGRRAFAIRGPVHAVAFNDAGDPDCLRLRVLDELGIPAVAVDAASARIGDAASTLHDGVLNIVNDLARQQGAEPGSPAAGWLEHVRSVH